MKFSILDTVLDDYESYSYNITPLPLLQGRDIYRNELYNFKK